MLVICNNLELKSEGSLLGEKAIVIIGTNVTSNVLLLTHMIIVLTSTWKYAIYRLRLWFLFENELESKGSLYY